MSKSSQVKRGKALVAKVQHSPTLQTYILAGLASASPPLGPQLGQRNINVADFCKDFNERTADIKEGIPLPCRVKVNSDRTYNLVIHQPPMTYFLKQAAGIQKAKLEKGDVAGKITLKHLYEIAVIKSQDPPMALLSLQQICEMIVGIARTCGIEIVRELNKEEYEEFLKGRVVKIEEFRQQLQERRDAKMLRLK